MKLKDMVFSFGEWVRGDGPEAEVVISSRVRLARNLEGYTFPAWAEASTLKATSEKILKAVEDSRWLRNSRKIDVDTLASLERQFLLERHLISMEFAREGQGRWLVVGEGEVISLLVNEEDHLRVQCILSGLQLTEAYHLADKIDTELGKNLDYAFSSRFGYLTSCPTNTGTGMRASCMLHLPGLVLTNRIKDVLKNISKLGFVARGLYGEGTESKGDLFQISNQLTLGWGEEELAYRVENVTRQVVQQEKETRETLLKKDAYFIRDKVGRAYGILLNAHLVSSEEAMNLLSYLRMGRGLNLLPPLSLRDLNELLFLISPAHLQIKEGRKLSPSERDRIRAEIIKEKLRR